MLPPFMILSKTNFYNAEASFCETINHERVGAGTPKVPRDAESNFLGGVLLSRGKEVDKGRAVVEKRLPQLRRHTRTVLLCTKLASD